MTAVGPHNLETHSNGSKSTLPFFSSKDAQNEITVAHSIVLIAQDLTRLEFTVRFRSTLCFLTLFRERGIHRQRHALIQRRLREREREREREKSISKK